MSHFVQNLVNPKRICMLLLTLASVWSVAAAFFFFVMLQWIDRWTFIVPTQVSELFVSMLIFGVIAAITLAAKIAARRRETCPIRWAQISVLGVLLLALISLDRAFLVAFPPPSELNSLLEPHPQRGWVLRRNAVGTDANVATRTNSLGLRGDEVPLPKPTGEFRILFIGDSVTFGYGLAEDQTLSARCGEQLRTALPHNTLRCTNAGVSGYTTWQELDYLKSDGLALQPDLIVLQFSFNDVLDVLLVDPGRVHGRRIDFEFSNTSQASGIARAIESIRARRYWEKAKNDLVWIDERDRQKAARLGAFQTMFAEPPPPAIEKAWQRVLADLSSFNDVCKSHGVPWVLVASPPRSQFDPKTAGPRPQKRLRALADELHAPMFDPLLLIEQYGKANHLNASLLYIDEGHPTPRTMSVVAKGLASFIVEHKLLNRASATGPTLPR
jgi:lysophospholipase L1-like esterase